MVGETGFMAKNNASVNDGMNGTLIDMGNFVNHSLNNTFNCGGSGYSWWQYQDLDWGVWGGDNYGILEHNMMPPSAEKQPAVSIFKNYIPQQTSACSVDYSPYFDQNRTYYNPFGYTSSNDKKITRHVIDQYGNPIKNAVVRVTTDFGYDILTIGHDSVWRYDEYYTFTDENGKFTAIPCPNRYGFVGVGSIPNTSPRISHLKISAAGADVFASGYLSEEYMLPHYIVINKIIDSIIVSNEIISLGENKEFKARKSLTVSNTTINAGGNAIFSSQKSISLLPGFTAKKGSNVTVTLAPIDCNDLTIFQYVQQSDEISLKSILKTNNSIVALPSFEEELYRNSFTIYPNPAKNSITINFFNTEKTTTYKYISLYDLYGCLLSFVCLHDSTYVLDTSMYPKGVYTVMIRDEFETYYQKIILQ